LAVGRRQPGTSRGGASCRPAAPTCGLNHHVVKLCAPLPQLVQHLDQVVAHGAAQAACRAVRRGILLGLTPAAGCHAAAAGMPGRCAETRSSSGNRRGAVPRPPPFIRFMMVSPVPSRISLRATSSLSMSISPNSFSMTAAAQRAGVRRSLGSAPFQAAATACARPVVLARWRRLVIPCHSCAQPCSSHAGLASCTAPASGQRGGAAASSGVQGCMAAPAMRLPWSCVRMWFSSVVLPEPRNPVMTCTRATVACKLGCLG